MHRLVEFVLKEVLMKPSVLVLLVVVAVLLAPRAAGAQGEQDDEGLLARIGGTVRVAPDERVDTAVVVGGDAVIEGTVTGALVVIGGDAVVSGTVGGTIDVVGGALELAPTARVADVMLTDSELRRAAGATVSGSVSERAGYHFGWGESIFSFVFWSGATLALLAAGLAFAAVGGRQLASAAARLTAQPLESGITAIVLWLGLPTIAVASFLTLVGIPVGLVILLAVLPALWVLGYLVAATRLGSALNRVLGVGTAARGPYPEVIAGVLALQIVGLVPVVGGIAVGMAGLFGAGGLGYLAWTTRRPSARRGTEGATTPSPASA